jgi:hypothetical protein
VILSEGNLKEVIAAGCTFPLLLLLLLLGLSSRLLHFKSANREV